jgi:protocatechuate 3,4-dioxygenase beta subunit
MISTRSWRWPLAVVLVLLATAALVRLLTASTSEPSLDDEVTVVDEEDAASFDPIDLPEPLVGSVEALGPSGVARSPKDFLPPRLGGGSGPKRAFSVRVVDFEGNGVPGARVGVWTKNASHPYGKTLAAAREAYFARYYPDSPADSDSVSWSWIVWADPTWRDPVDVRKTDEDGRCSLALPDGKLAIAAAHPTAGTSGRWIAEPWEALAGPDGSEPFELVLQIRPPCRVTGQVVGPDDQAVAGALVLVSNPGGRLARCEPRLPRPVTCDDEGRFALEIDAAGFSYLCALGRGQWSTRRVISVEAGSSTRITLRIGSAASLSGRVLDPDDRPVAGAQLEASGPGFQREHTQSSDDGSFSLALPERGRWLVGAAKDDWLPQEVVALDIGASQPAAEATLRLIESATIRGSVHSKTGEPVAGATISTMPNFKSGTDAFKVFGVMMPYQRCTSDADGRFELTHLHPAMKYDVRVGREYSREPAATEVAPGSSIELEVDGGLPDSWSLDGRVVDDETGEPIEAFSLSVEFGRDTGGRFAFARELRPFRSPEGSFHVDGIRWAEAHVRVLAAHYSERVVGPVVLATQTSPLEIRLGRPARLDVSVIDAQGEAVAGAVVLLKLDPPGESTDFEVAREATADAAGHASWVGLPPETYSLQAMAAAGTSPIGTVTLLSGGQHQHVLTLEGDADVGRLVVRVLGQAGEVLPDVAVDLMSFGWKQAAMLPRRLETDDKGEATFVGLRPGSYSAIAHVAGSSAFEQAAVEAGATATIELRPSDS